MKKESFRFYWEDQPKRKLSDLRIEVPGFRKDEIKAAITNDSIIVKANRKDKKVIKGKNFYREKASASSLSKSMMLPKEINPENFSIVIRDGEVILKKKNNAR